MYEPIHNGNGRFIVNMPPRHGKSEFISNWLPTWYLSTYPDRNIILTSYETEYATSWGRKVRNNIETSDLISLKIEQDSKAANRFHTSKGGSMISTGLGGAITGKGGHLIVIDDPVKNFQESRSASIRNRQINAFNNDLYTRLEPGGTIILLMTRWHQEDLAGHLLEEHEDNWVHINLPALAHNNDPLGRQCDEALCAERYDKESLLKIKNAIGSVAWNGLYQQQPSSDEGDILKREWWRFHDDEVQVDEMIQSWDMRFKDSKTSGDYVVGQVWGRKGNNKYLLDQVRGRWSFVETQNMFISLSSKWPKAYVKLIENKANGPAIENVLKNKVSGIKLVEPMGGKEARAFAAQPALEGGTVYLPNPNNEPWVNELIEESANFPSGKHDDMVDSMTQAIIHFERKLNRSLYKLAKF